MFSVQTSQLVTPGCHIKPVNVMPQDIYSKGWSWKLHPFIRNLMPKSLKSNYTHQNFPLPRNLMISCTHNKSLKPGFTIFWTFKAFFRNTRALSLKKWLLVFLLQENNMCRLTYEIDTWITRMISEAIYLIVQHGLLYSMTSQQIKKTLSNIFWKNPVLKSLPM